MSNNDHHYTILCYHMPQVIDTNLLFSAPLLSYYVLYGFDKYFSIYCAKLNDKLSPIGTNLPLTYYIIIQ